MSFWSWYNKRAAFCGLLGHTIKHFRETRDPIVFFAIKKTVPRVPQCQKTLTERQTPLFAFPNSVRKVETSQVKWQEGNEWGSFSKDDK